MTNRTGNDNDVSQNSFGFCFWFRQARHNTLLPHGVHWALSNFVFFVSICATVEPHASLSPLSRGCWWISSADWVAIGWISLHTHILCTWHLTWLDALTLPDLQQTDRDRERDKERVRKSVFYCARNLIATCPRQCKIYAKEWRFMIASDTVDRQKQSVSHESKSKPCQVAVKTLWQQGEEDQVQIQRGMWYQNVLRLLLWCNVCTVGIFKEPCNAIALPLSLSFPRCFFCCRDDLYESKVTTPSGIGHELLPNWKRQRQLLITSR